MMGKNYSDIVRTMASMKAKGYEVDRVVLTNETIETFLTDAQLTEEAEKSQNDLGEFAVNVETGDGNYILSESGKEVDL